MKRRLIVPLLGAGLLLSGAAGASTAAAHHRPDRACDVRVVGEIGTPLEYTSTQLAAMAQTTLPDLRTRRAGDEVTGTLLQPLVAASGPVLPVVKNAALRVTVTVSGHRREAVAVAMAELDPNNGNHPALLVASRGRHSRGAGVDLVFPGDRGFARTVHHVSKVDVAVAAPALPADVPSGAIRLVDGRRSVTLTAADLSRLPARTRTVSFLSGSGPQQHVETGPTLARVLRAARIRTSSTTTVAAIADDGYVATVTPAEATSGRRPLLLSLVEDGTPLAQPRLVTDGDVYGGRYVSGVLSLQVSGRRARG